MWPIKSSFEIAINVPDLVFLVIVSLDKIGMEPADTFFSLAVRSDNLYDEFFPGEGRADCGYNPPEVEDSPEEDKPFK